MACNFNFTEKAESDLDEILSYITNELCVPTAASELGRKIFENIDTVCEFPETGKLVQNEYVKDSEVRRVLIDNYILYYMQKAIEYGKPRYVMYKEKTDCDNLMFELNREQLKTGAKVLTKDSIKELYN